MNITLPAIVNGQTLPGGVDRYRFQAHKGMGLVVVAAARELIPYLPTPCPAGSRPPWPFTTPRGMN